MNAISDPDHTGPEPERPDPVRVAAIGDLHVTEQDNRRYRDMFEEISRNADILALCGDLTNFGKTSEGRAAGGGSLRLLGPHRRRAGQS